ncbi:hypothetical protein BU15DRAFT_65743 [Melanogaster broomeanus]|nr:hypothetical protein BU15DRAFT_65743 [Melanogaster broomeanus]
MRTTQEDLKIWRQAPLPSQQIRGIRCDQRQLVHVDIERGLLQSPFMLQVEPMPKTYKPLYLKSLAADPGELSSTHLVPKLNVPSLVLREAEFLREAPPLRLRRQFPATPNEDVTVLRECNDDQVKGTLAEVAWIKLDGSPPVSIMIFPGVTVTPHQGNSTRALLLLKWASLRPKEALFSSPHPRTPVLNVFVYGSVAAVGAATSSQCVTFCSALLGWSARSNHGCEIGVRHCTSARWEHRLGLPCSSGGGDLGGGIISLPCERLEATSWRFRCQSKKSGHGLVDYVLA